MRVWGADRWVDRFLSFVEPGGDRVKIGDT